MISKTELLKELEMESATTRRMLECVPEDKYSWKPHPKSFSMGELATHIAELPSWVEMALLHDGLDFQNNPYQREKVNDNAGLFDYFERMLAKGKKALQETDEQLYGNDWTLRSGDQVYSVTTKAETIRMAYCQIVHHRAQLGVYLRLLDIPLPGSYGPTADEGF